MDPIAEWLIDNALSIHSLSELLEGVCDRLAADGLPVIRGNISLTIIDPVSRARYCTWWRGQGARDIAIPHDSDLNQYQRSPIRVLFETGEMMRHWRLDALAQREFPLFEEIAAAGATDYLALMHPFSSPDFGGLRGAAFTVASDRPTGFTSVELTRLRLLGQLIASIVYRLILGDIAITLMDAYVGLPASRRILHGQVHRGVGEPIEAVLLMADLIGFTPIADASGLDLIERLDEHLEAMSAPVIKRGGSILKFMGDAILAVFPITDEIAKPAACRLAFESAIDAIERNALVNGQRRDARPLHLDVALSYGEVFYGNVGAPGRLDFTVIGPAVNEVARIEALCGVLGCNLLVSDDVAAELEAPMLSLGRQKLRGIEAEREVFTPEERIGERKAILGIRPR
jgi:adenylate cyclase